ncbi:MAG: reprolysin-like metallopeptidase, partial [Acidobacteriota bacterium]
ARAAEITLPLADGRLERFAVRPSATVPEELAARYPGVRVFRARGIDDPRLTASFSDLEQGFSAWIRTPAGLNVVEPLDSGDSSSHVVYRRAELARGAAPSFRCQVHRERPVAPRGRFEGLQMIAQSASTPVPADHRTYVLALAATGEYTQFHGGTVGSALAEMATAIDRVNTIFEPEIGVTLVLHPDTDELIFTNPSTDPYTNDDGSAMMAQNQVTIDDEIGNGNYDVGHVFSTGGGGIAFVQSVCWSPNKARGVTGLETPVGDPFYVDYVAHELGHQLGADHTFNASTDLCGENDQRVPEIAFEPGSGSTIMGYAGLCGAEDLQINSDPYFHFSSLSDIEVYVTDTRVGWGGDPSCVALDVTGNMTPSVDAGPDYVIPVGTPFELTGSATDDVGVSSYVWEQSDAGPATTAATLGSDDGQGPLFRSRMPSSVATRTFPRMADVLSGTPSLGEILPVQGRIRPDALTLKLIARDDDPRGGGWGIDEMEIEIDAGSGPFAVLFPNGGETLAGSVQVQWDVAGTDGAPVSCSAVDVLLSTDGGADFSIVLLEETPNDGAESTQLPQVTSDRVRLLVRCSDSVFFDVSNADLAIAPVEGLPFGDGFESGSLIRWSQP